MSVVRADKVSYSTAGFGDTLTHDLAFGVPSAQAFFPAQDSAAVMAQIDRHAYPRAQLAAVLDETARRFNAPEAVLRNIHLLREATTYVVATGQQAGFLGGPLYTIHKAVSAICLARKFAADSQGRARFVPVFWIAGDDHDLAEIDHADFLKPDGTLARVRATFSTESAGCSACDAFIDRSETSLKQLGAELAAALNDEALAGEFIRVYMRHSMSDAFMVLMLKWLGELGLVVVQSSDMRRFGAELLLRELSEFDVTIRLIQESAVALTGSGYKPGFASQGRAGPHFFITSEPAKIRAHLDAVAGSGREEFQERSAAFAARAQQPRRYTKAELAALIQARPELFSCGAALRPVLQQKIFPVVAAILGPGEIAYWAQLKKVHDHFDAVWPMVFPRATTTLLDGPGEKAMRKLQLAPVSRDMFLDAEALVKKVLDGGAVGVLLDERIARIQAELTAMEADVSAADGGLKSLFEKSRERIVHELQRVSEKTKASLGQREDAGAARARYLSALVRPRKMPQERVLSCGQFMARFPTLPQDLAGAIDLPAHEHLVLTLA